MKKFFMVVMIMGLLLLVVGCGKKGDVLRLATWDSEESLKTLKAIAEKFEETHPDVKVQIEAYGDGFDKKLSASFGAKNPPDVMYMWDFPKYQASLEPLNTYIDNDDSFKIYHDDLFPGLLNYTTIGNDILGMPAGFTSHVMYYNKALFDQAGVAYPTDDWTWSELREKAKKISELGDDINGLALSTQPDPYDFEQFFWVNGSSYLSPDGTAIDGYFNSPASIEMMQLFVDMIKEGSAYGAQSKISDTFRNNKLAIQESGIWPLKRHLEVIGKENLGIAPLPRMEKSKPANSVINSSGISMAKDSKNKELAWEFIKFYTSPEAVKMRSEVDLPVLKSVANELGYLEDPYYAPYYKMLETAEEYRSSFLLHPEWTKISENISMAIESSLVGIVNNQDVDVKELFDTAVKESEKFFKE